MELSVGLCLDNIDKLHDENFHIWIARIHLILSLNEVKNHFDDEPPEKNFARLSEWHKADVKAKEIIGLTLSDAHLEQVQHASIAKEMWGLICNIFEKHTLLNKLAALRRFHTAKMQGSENVLQFTARIRQLAATLKSMSVNLEDCEMAMALLNGFSDRFDSLISALDAANIYDEKFSFEFVKSRRFQEEQRHALRNQNTLKSSESVALFNKKTSRTKRVSSMVTCIHCGKHQDSNRCYKKYPHLAPRGHKAQAYLDKGYNAEKSLIACQHFPTNDKPVDES